MTSHSKIAQFNWKCIGRLRRVTGLAHRVTECPKKKAGVIRMRRWLRGRSASSDHHTCHTWHNQVTIQTKYPLRTRSILHYHKESMKQNLVANVVCCGRRTCNYCSAGMFTKSKHKGYKLHLINLLWKILEAKTKFMGHMESLSVASFGPGLDEKFHVFTTDPESHNDTPLYSITSQLNPGNIFTTFAFKYRLDDILLSTYGYPTWFVRFTCSINNFVYISHLPVSATCSTHHFVYPPWVYNPNNTVYNPNNSL
jgi:hypothetical protein